MNLRIQLINTPTAQCGVSEFGRRMGTAMAQAGITLVPAGGPADIILVNWHPMTMGEGYLPPNPRGVPVTAYFHDTPKWSSSKLWDACAVRFTSEPWAGATEVPYPATDFTPEPGEHIPPFTLGTTGIRGDGTQAIHEYALQRGWWYNGPNMQAWATDREEIQRLANSDLNVLWYYASGRGKSLALMSCAAARKPLLINSSEMFSQAWPYEDEIYRAPVGMGLPEAIDWARGDGLKRVPKRLPVELGWGRMLRERMVPEWEALI